MIIHHDGFGRNPESLNGPDVVVREALIHTFSGANYILSFLSIICTFTSISTW